MGQRTCTCQDQGRCGYCPSIATTANRQGGLVAVSGDNARQSMADGARATRRVDRRWRDA